MKHKTQTSEMPVSSEYSTNRDLVTRAEKAAVASHISDMLGFSAQGISLDVQQMRSVAAKDSAHDVFQLLASDMLPDETTRQALACKRYRKIENAEKERDALVEAKRRGFNTPEPVGQGIYIMEGIGSILVTEYIPRFNSMNHIGWRDYYAGQDDYERTLVPTLHSIGAFAGKLHGAGITHHDFQLKNIAQVPPRKFICFDLEGSSFFEPLVPGEEAPYEHSDRMLDDMRTLTRSLVEKGFLWSASDARFRDETVDHLYMPYLTETGLITDNFVEGLDRITDDAIALRHNVHRGLALDGPAQTF
jgi:hypothetical protein